MKKFTSPTTTVLAATACLLVSACSQEKAPAAAPQTNAPAAHGDQTIALQQAPATPAVPRGEPKMAKEEQRPQQITSQPPSDPWAGEYTQTRIPFEYKVEGMQMKPGKSDRLADAVFAGGTIPSLTLWGIGGRCSVKIKS